MFLSRPLRLLCCLLHPLRVPVLLPADCGGETAAGHRHPVDGYGLPKRFSIPELLTDLLNSSPLECSGPKVVSHKISVESIVEVTSALKRPPVIWDNIHANDYDPQRLFLGPYKVDSTASSVKRCCDPHRGLLFRIGPAH